jgi:D-alanyl-D-alanine dipeptidase
MTEIINIADPKVLKIPIAECSEELIDLKNQDEIYFGAAPESPLTINDYTWIRKSIYEMLCLAQKALPNNWRFKIYEGFRSRKVQELLFEQQYKALLKKFPKKSREELFYEVTCLVSPVINIDGSVNIPAHNTGGAIDIELITKNGDLIEMGMAAKDWKQVDPKLCATNYSYLEKNILNNRKILFEVMTGHDFVNYQNEWWHYSYGDRYWAYIKQAASAIYGSADHLQFKGA